MQRSMRALAILAACLCLLPPALAQPQHQSGSEMEFDLPAQPMDAALRQLADKHKLQIVFSPNDVRGLMAPEVKGRLTIDAALQKLTAGTRLGYSFNGRDAVVIRVDERRSAPVSSNSPESPIPGERITVTAQKREELLIDVPQSVTVLSANDLARMGATQFRDFANTIPGLSFGTTGPGQNSITLRGVTTGFDVSPTVGIYVDEVPIGSGTTYAAFAQIGLDVGIFDLDRIEILRGPQGTLYGASTMGGLLKYVTKRPDPTRASSSVQVGVSSTHDGGSSYVVSGAMNAPLAATTAARASVFYSRDGGYIDAVALGKEDVNRASVYGARGDLLFSPSADLSVRVTAFLQNISRDGEGTAEYTFAGGMPWGELGHGRVIDEPFYQRFKLGSAVVKYDLGRASLTSVTSYQSLTKGNWLDISSVYVPLLRAALQRTYGAMGYYSANEVKKWTQEVRINSEEDARPFEWVVGGFYTREKSVASAFFSPRTVDLALAPNDLYTYAGPSTYNEFAVFGDVTWHFTPRFDVTAGLRYARDEQEFTQIGSGVLIGSRPLAKATEDVVTYLANARYKLGEQATAYLRYATGYRPGGPNIAANDSATGLPLGPPTFEADELRSYEAGLKAESANGVWGLDLAGYYADWKNIQLIATRGGFAFRANAQGGATVRGLELTASTRPTRGLSLTGAFSYQDAKLSDANPDLRAAPGERLPGVPRFTAALNADYELAGMRLRPSLGATIRHVTERRAGFDAGVGAARQYILPEYTTVDLRAGLTFGKVRTQFYVHNVFDEPGQLSAMFPQFGPRIAILRPRTFGVNVTAQF